LEEKETLEASIKFGTKLFPSQFLKLSISHFKTGLQERDRERERDGERE